jgi:hypothetical protein
MGLEKVIPGLGKGGGEFVVGGNFGVWCVLGGGNKVPVTRKNLKLLCRKSGEG